MSLEAWGDENPDDRDADALLEAGWIDPDTAHEWMRVMFMAAPHHQGGLSPTGRALAGVLGAEFPLRMDNLIGCARRMNHDPAELWPWSSAARRVGKGDV